MIPAGSLRLVVFYLMITSIIFTFLGFLQVQYQYYFWEFFIDLKVAGLVLLAIFLYKKGNFQLSIDALGLSRLGAKGLLFWFVFPALIYLLIVGMGLVFRTVTFNDLDNALTLILATLFDIPAITVFSIFFVLLEELFFRGVIVNSFLGYTTKLKAISISALLWTIYAAPDFLAPERFTFPTLLLLLLYTFSIGVFNAQLSLKYRSVIFPYIFRIGIISLTPILLTSITNETDSFFTAKSLAFSAEGLVVSLFLLIFSVALYRQDYVVKTEGKMQNLAA